MITMVINHLLTEMIIQAVEQVQINPGNVTLKMFPQKRDHIFKRKNGIFIIPTVDFQIFSDALFLLTPSKN